MLKFKKKGIAPIFITGAWRSGTTLISRILNNHPDLEVTYDTVHFMRFSFNRYNPINNKKNVNKLIIDTSKRLYERYDLKINNKDVFEIINGNYNYKKIYDAIMQVLLFKKERKKIWGEKTNLAWTKIPDFFKMYPKGRVIHIVRDPRAVLYSWKKFTKAPMNDYLDSVLNCYDSMKTGIIYKEKFKHKRYQLIKYEDLVSNPIHVIKTICKKFEIKYDKNMINAKLFKDMHQNKWHANSIHKKMKGISIEVINKWKKGLYDWEIYLTETILNDILNSFNYKLIKIKKTKKIIDEVIKNITNSNLACRGFIEYILTKEGFERYPSDPLLKKNW